MRLISCLCLFIFMLACKKDEGTSYPKSYTFHSTELGDEGLFIVSNNQLVIPISPETGSYKTFKGELKSEVAEAMKMAFDIQEIELLSESSVHIRIVIDDEVTDTIVNYTVEEGEIIIEALESNNLFSYNKDKDQFELCGRAQFALSGPNVTNPGQEYNQYNVAECLVDFDPEDYAQMMLTEFEYQPLDTLGVFITKLTYK